MLDGRTLSNSGTATFSSTNYLHGKNGAIFNNLSGAMVDLQGTNAFVNGGGTLPVVNNAGTFRKSVSTGNINIGFAMNNTGTVEVQSGTLTLQSSVTQLVGNTLTGGTWKVYSNSSLSISSGPSININQGNVTLDGVASTFVGINPLANNQGNFSILNGRNFITASNLANSGTVTVGIGCNFIVSGILNNTGTAEVSGGTLTVNNSVAQLTGTTLAGGTWNARSNSTINFTTGSDISTNLGNVTLDGAGSLFDKINTIADNQGSFSILNGRNFTTMGDLANSGSLTVGSGSDFEVNGNLTGAGNLNVSGLLTADSIVQDTLTIGAGAIVTIRPLSGGPLAAQYQFSPVPEPATLTLLLLAGLGLGLWRLRRRDG
jgi:hypothetical protein